MGGDSEELYNVDAEEEPYVSSQRYGDPKEDFKTVGRKLQEVLDVKKSHSVADFGCANGELLYYLHQKFPHWDLHGYDVTPEFIETARGFEGLSEVNFHQRDFFDVEESFDVVLATAVVEIFPDFEEPLGKMISCCEPGGYVIVTGLFNEHDVEVRVRFRERSPGGNETEWKQGYNRHPRRLIRKRFGQQVQSLEFDPCPFNTEISPDPDNPLRVWTFKDEQGRNILTNGAHQLLNQTLLTIQR